MWNIALDYAERIELYTREPTCNCFVWFSQVEHNEYTYRLLLSRNQMHLLRNPRGNVLAGTFVLMKENFGVWKCNIEPNTRYYLLPLIQLECRCRAESRSKSDTRAWYSWGIEKKTQPTTEISGSGNARGEALSPSEALPLITACEKHAPKYHISMTSLFLLCMGLDDLLCRMQISIYKIVLSFWMG